VCLTLADTFAYPTANPDGRRRPHCGRLWFPDALESAGGGRLTSADIPTGNQNLILRARLPHLRRFHTRRPGRMPVSTSALQQFRCRRERLMTAKPLPVAPSGKPAGYDIGRW